MNHTPKIHADGSVLGHRWESMGYVAPFAFAGYERMVYQACPGAPFQPGTACDYCGTGITNVFWIKDADGKRFKVGSDCVRHLNDTKLRVIVESEVRKLNKIKKHEREAQIVHDLMPQWVNALMALDKYPHPTPYFAEKGKTLGDYWRFCSKSSLNMKRAINEALAKAGVSHV